ncbi:MAG TPA: hypothetical protein VFO25_06825 [Candidatus Eremiobacteraceae bacterium]|nr:hypothetical protein [Candidatus Eremiobacteraceae bacterium]
MTLARGLSAAVSGLALSYFLLGCGSTDAGNPPDSAGVLANVPVKSDGPVSLEVSSGNANVDIKVIGWDGGYVKVSQTRSDHTSTKVEVLKSSTEGGATLRITVTPTSTLVSDLMRLRQPYESISVRIPRQARFSLTTSNGAVEIDKVIGPINVKTDNGPVTVDDTGSVVDVDTQNGPIMIGVADASRVPDIRVSLLDGPIELRVPKNFKSDIQTHVTFGPVNVDSSIQSGPGTVNLRTVAGPIDVIHN